LAGRWAKFRSFRVICGRVRSANRVTQLRVVMLALSCVTLVVGFGLVHSALSQEPISISTIVARATGTIIRAF
jgi:hypothetical protein